MLHPTKKDTKTSDFSCLLGNRYSPQKTRICSLQFIGARLNISESGNNMVSYVGWCLEQTSINLMVKESVYPFEEVKR